MINAMDGGIRVNRESLVRTLERQILAGTIGVGQSLPSERRLAEHFNMSRTVVREALSVLAERGLIEIATGKGAYVRAADPTATAGVLVNSMRGRHVTARHVIRGRKLLESETSWLAAENRTDEDLARMERSLESLEGGDSVLDRVRSDLEFHLAVARSCHDPVLEAMFGSISELSAELMLRSLSDTDVAARGLPQHRQILDAIRAKDPAAARDAMVAHLNVASEHYGADLDRDLAIVAQRQLKGLEGADHSLAEIFKLAMDA